MNSDDEIIPSHMFDRIMERFDKLESLMDANDRRLGKLRPPSHPKPLYSQPPTRQPSGWDPPPHRAARRYSSYDQPRRPTCWDPPLYRQTPYTDMDSSYASRQYTTANFGQPPYSSDESPRKPYAGYHRGQHEYQPTPPPYRPPRSPTCWESPEYVPPIPLGCPPPHAAESRRLSRPHLLHDPSSSSLPAALAVPPPPLQRSPSCCPTSSAAPLPAAAAAAVPSVNWSPPAPPCSPDFSVEEGELLHDGPPPPAPILQLYNPDISEEEETLLEDKEEDGSIGEVEKIIASFSVARMSSKDVEICWFKRGGACTGVRIIAYIYVDFFDGDVTSIVQRSTSLDVDARFIPPRNDTPCLSILGGVYKFFVLAWNFADHIGSPLLIFDGGETGRRSAVRCAFDPGGEASPKLLLSTLVVASWFPP